MQKNYNKDLYRLSFKMKKELQRRVFISIFNIFILFILINAVISFVVFPVCEHSNSMGPDIAKNSLSFVTTIKLPLKRGDVVLVDKEEGTKTIQTKFLDSFFRFFTLQKKSIFTREGQISSQMVLRRVIGVPGDTVYMKDFMVYIKPEGEKHFLSEFEVISKKYNIDIYNLPENWDTSIGLKDGFTPVILGTNQYLVLADNRFSSMDSRLWGIISKKDIEGKALVLYFPFNKFRIL